MTKDENDLEKMSLLSHLIELRKRLLTVTIVFLLLFFLCFIKFTDNNQNFADLVYVFLQQPLADKIAQTGGRMIFTALHEGFFTQVKVAFFISMTIAFPILLIQLWKFIAPGLYESERRFTAPLMISTILLFFCGVSFAFFVVCPIIFKFFVGMAPDSIQVMTDINQYLSFVFKLVFAFGIAFEIPIATVLLINNEIVTKASLIAARPYLIILFLVVGMLLTPPDIFSQLFLAIPMWILFEVGILFSRNK